MSTEAFDRLAQLKALYDTTTVSDNKTPTPLWVYLYIYTRASGICYMNYMEGAKLLYKYLSPIELPIDKFAAIEDEHCPVPTLLSGYDSWELAKIIDPKNPRRASRAIMISMYKEVLPLLY